MTGTICICGLAKTYHEGDNALAYRPQDGVIRCLGYTPRYPKKKAA
jgi:hypothetical protein